MPPGNFFIVAQILISHLSFISAAFLSRRIYIFCKINEQILCQQLPRLFIIF